MSPGEGAPETRVVGKLLLLGSIIPLIDIKQSLGTSVAATTPIVRRAYQSLRMECGAHRLSAAAWPGRHAGNDGFVTEASAIKDRRSAREGSGIQQQIWETCL